MKQILIALLLIISVNSFSQTGTSATTSSTKPPITIPADSISFISTKDLDSFLKWLPENYSHSAYSKLSPEDVIKILYQWCVSELNKKKKK